MTPKQLTDMLTARGYSNKTEQLQKRQNGGTPEQMYVNKNDRVVVFITPISRFPDETRYLISTPEQLIFFPFLEKVKEYKAKKYKVFFLAGISDSNKHPDWYAPLKEYFVAIEFFHSNDIEKVNSTIIFRYEDDTVDPETKDVPVTPEKIKAIFEDKPKYVSMRRGKKTSGESADQPDLRLLFIRQDLLDDYIAFSDSRTYKDTIPVDVTHYVQDTSAPTESRLDTVSHNLLIYGAPGTGKSYYIDKKFGDTFYPKYFPDKKNSDALGELVAEAKENYQREGIPIPSDDKLLIATIQQAVRNTYFTRVTFYEDYSYESFVGCYKPIKQGDKLTYAFEPGPFLKMYIDAVRSQKEAERKQAEQKKTEQTETEQKKETIQPHLYLLAIEEINRAKAAAVFGDLFQVLDRDSNGRSQYAIKPETALDTYLRGELGDDYDGTISLPSNLYIWATMNSADQGVYVLDSAFKRRWEFLYMDIKAGSDRKIRLRIKKDDQTLPAKLYYWDKFREAINTKLEQNYEEDRWIGSWFLTDEELDLIDQYYSATDAKKRVSMSNPLVDKLLAYLLQDVVKITPQDLFKDGYHHLSSIRRALSPDSEVAINDILDIDVTKLEEYIPETDDTPADNADTTPQQAQPADTAPQQQAPAANTTNGSGDNE